MKLEKIIPNRRSYKGGCYHSFKKKEQSETKELFAIKILSLKIKTAIKRLKDKVEKNLIETEEV